MPTEVRADQILKASSGSYATGTVKRNKTLVTSDATATVIDASPVIAVGQAVMIRGGVVGKKSDGTAAIDAQLSGSARRQSAGNVTLVGTPLVVAREDSSGTPAVTFVANTTTQQLEIKVAGIAAETWNWESNLEITVI